MRPNKVYKIIKIFLLTIILPAFLILMYKYKKMFPPKILPEGFEKYNVPPEEYAIVILGSDVVEKLYKKNLTGYAMSVEKVYGPKEDKSIDNLKLSFNSIISGYQKWKLITNREQFEIIKQRKKFDLEQKKELIRAGLINTQKYAEFLTESEKLQINYDVFLRWRYKNVDETLCELTCEIVNRSNSVVEVVSSVIFTHPVIYKNYIKIIKLLNYFSYISSGYIVLVVFIVFTLLVNLNLKKKKIISNLSLIEQEIYNLIQNGSFTTALKMIDTVLDFLPDYSPIFAIKERLMVVTKNDPEKAQQAYVRYSNLKTKFHSGLLSQVEMSELNSIEESLDLPEVVKFVSLCKTYTKLLEINTLLSLRKEKVLKLISAGSLEQAKNELDKLQNEKILTEYQLLTNTLKDENPSFFQVSLPPYDNFLELVRDVNEKIIISKQKLEEAKKLVSEGDIYQAEELLKETIMLNQDLEEAKKLYKEINEAKNITAIKLVSEKINEEIVIIKKDVISIFRRDKKHPDIEVNLPQISRDKHLKISIFENEVIAEDENSTNGTFVCGKKILKCQLQNGDIINLAGIYEIITHIYYGKSEKLKDNQQVRDTIPSEIKISIQNSTVTSQVIGLFLNTQDNRKYIIIPSVIDKSWKIALPLKLSAAGFEYSEDENSKIKILFNNGVIMLGLEEQYSILLVGKVLEFKGYRYKVEKY
ncbi:MAG: FHA domain-containing protein [Endomicrobia bacterium]|nr:FHA domain-containing protein [Endomicrobiia bacterium]